MDHTERQLDVTQVIAIAVIRLHIEYVYTAIYSFSVHLSSSPIRTLWYVGMEQRNSEWNPTMTAIVFNQLYPRNVFVFSLFSPLPPLHLLVLSLLV